MPGRRAGLVAVILLLGTALARDADSIAAVVGKKVILESDIQQVLLYLRLVSGDETTPDSVLRPTVLQRLIDEAVLSEQAERESVEVTREEISTEIAENIAALRQRFDSEEEFRAALVSEGLSEKVLRERMEQEVRRNFLSRRLLEKVGLTQIYVSPAEVEEFYNEHKDSIARMPGRVELAHILIMIKPSDSAEAAAELRAREVLDLLLRGGDFATLARSFSDDPRTRGRGGDWGWQDTADLAPELMLVLKQLKPGQFSPRFRTQEGYYIVQLTGWDKARVRFRTIVIRVPLTRADTLRARNLAEKLKNLARQGRDFASLAKEFSDDPQTGAEGGYLGEFFIEGLMPPFDRLIAELDSGEVGEPVLSEHGFHVIKVLAKQPAQFRSFLEMQDVIRNYLSEQRFAERLRGYINRVARGVYIEIKGKEEGGYFLDSGSNKIINK